MNDHMMNEKKWIALRTTLLTAVAVMLVLSAVMGSAWAYFTTYARAKGGYPIVLGHEEHDDEKFSNWEKTLSITVSKDSRPVYLRARAFCADYPLLFSDEDIPKDAVSSEGLPHENWKQLEKDGEWWYHTELVDPGKEKGENDSVSAKDFHVRIQGVRKTEEEGAMVGDEFNVIIVYEATEVQYDKDGNELPWDQVDWTKKVQTQRVQQNDN